MSCKQIVSCIFDPRTWLVLSAKLQMTKAKWRPLLAPVRSPHRFRDTALDPVRPVFGAVVLGTTAGTVPVPGSGC